MAHGDGGAVEAVAAGAAPAETFDAAWTRAYQGRLEARMVPALSEAARRAAQWAASQLSLDWMLVNQDALAWAAEYGYSWISGLTDTTRTLVQDAISRWIESGEHLDVLTKRLTEIFASPVRAEMIASTEVTRVFQKANEMAWRRANAEFNAGIVGAEWRTAVDEHVCPICRPMHGRTRPLDSQYIDPESGEPRLMPAHVRCRCMEVPILTPPGSQQRGPGPRSGA